MLNLKAEKREETGKKLAKGRKDGKLPAIVYGHKTEATSLFIDQKDFSKLWKEAGESSLISLETPDGKKDTLIHDVDVHPVSGDVRHVDFYAIDATKPVEIKIPIEFVGTAPAVKSLGGILVKVLHDLEISVLPTALPHSIKVDLTSLEEFDSLIHARDVKLPEGATLVTGGDEIVASIAEPKEEEEEAAPVDLDAIEVEQKGKGEEATEGAEAPKEEAKTEAKEG